MTLGGEIEVTVAEEAERQTVLASASDFRLPIDTGSLVIFPLVSRLNSIQQVLEAEHLEDQQQAVRVNQEGSQMLEFDYI